MPKILFFLMIVVSILSTNCHYTCCSIAEGPKLGHPSNNPTIISTPATSLNTQDEKNTAAPTPTSVAPTNEIIAEGTLETNTNNPPNIVNTLESIPTPNPTPVNEEIKPAKELTGLQTESWETDDPIDVGQKTTYVLTLWNNGPKNTQNLKVRSILPKQSSFVSAEAQIEDNLVPLPGKLDEEKKYVEFETIPELTPMVKVVYKVTVKVEEPGDLVHTFEIFTDEFTDPIKKQEGTKAQMPIAEPEPLTPSTIEPEPSTMPIEPEPTTPSIPGR